MGEENLIPFYEMTSEQMKKQYPTLNALYYNCWFKERHYILDYCEIKFITKEEKHREAKIVIRFKNDSINSYNGIVFNVDIYNLYDKKLNKKVYRTGINIEEISNCDFSLLRLINATCDILKEKFDGIDLSQSNSKSYFDILNVLDKFDIYGYDEDECEQESNCEDK